MLINSVTSALAKTVYIPLALITLSNSALAEQIEDESPWIITPTLSSNPKLGSSVGLLGGYLYNFDDSSPASLFGATTSRSDTGSEVYAVFANTYFDDDHQRLIVGHVELAIDNEYEDFLGLGITVNTTDDVSATVARYLYRISDNWFIGAQAVDTNYNLIGRDTFSDAILKVLGLSGYQGRGVGPVVEHDRRDNVNNPKTGDFFQASYTGYYEALGSNNEFGAWSAKYARYDTIGERHTIATQIETRNTNDAPRSAYSSVNLRGYTVGEYLAPHNVSIEIEDRIQLTERWGATIFAGATCLYGDGQSCSDSTSWYPMIGGGISYLIKPTEGMVVRLEGARGEGDNYGVYLQFGNPF